MLIAMYNGHGKHGEIVSKYAVEEIPTVLSSHKEIHSNLGSCSMPR
jgi:hypothetical protein